MKTTLLATLLVASIPAHAQSNVATIPTLKLFEHQFSGATTQFYGEVHIPEPLAYNVFTGGGKGFDYSIGWGHDTLAEAQEQQRYLTATIDQLAPVRRDRATSAQVAPGHCAILTDADYFGGRWNVLGPGNHLLTSYSYFKILSGTVKASFNDVARSVATYKMIGSGCKPEADIPMLWSDDAKMYPLVIKDGTRDQAEFGENVGNGRLFVTSRYPKHYRIASDSYGYMVFLGGGFSSRAKRLTVPKCYNVALDYTRGTGTEAPQTSFPPGSHVLANHGITNGVISATVTRSPGCAQEPRPAPIKMIGADICIHPNGGSATPGNGTWAVYHTGCKSESRLSFSFTAGGSLRQASSGMCLHPLGGSATPALNTPLVFFQGCDEPRLRFELTTAGVLRHVSSGLCVVPEGHTNPWVMPPNATRLILASCAGATGPMLASRINGTEPYILTADGIEPFPGLPN